PRRQPAHGEDDIVLEKRQSADGAFSLAIGEGDPLPVDPTVDYRCLSLTAEVRDLHQIEIVMPPVSQLLQHLAGDVPGYDSSFLLCVAEHGMRKVIAIEIERPGSPRRHHEARAKPGEQHTVPFIWRWAGYRCTRVRAKAGEIGERPWCRRFARTP